MSTATNRHKGRQLPTRVEPEIWAALERIAAREDRKLAQVARILIKEALRARGELPGPPTT